METDRRYEVLNTVGGKQLRLDNCVLDYASPHDSYEFATVFDAPFLIINLSGSFTHASVNCDKVKPTRLPRNTCVFSPSGTQIYERAAKSSVDIVLLHFKSSALEKIQNEKDRQYWPTEHRADLVDPILGNIGQEIRRTLIAGNPEGPHYLEHLSNAVACRMLQLFQSTSGSYDKNNWISDAIVKQVEEFVEANLSEAISLDDLSRLAGIPTSYLNKAYLNSSGYTLYQMILEKRIAKARVLLARNELPIAEIAYACGFSSQQHMTNSFSKKLGVSPGRYRKLNSNL